MISEREIAILMELNIFKKKEGDRFKIVGTSVEYCPYGRRMRNSALPWEIKHVSDRWWLRGEDRKVRPVSVDMAIKAMPPEIRDVFIFNVNIFRD